MGNKVVIHFDHAGSGQATTDRGPVRGLEIGEVPGTYRWATAKIQGDKLIVASDRYQNPQVGTLRLGGYPLMDKPDQQGGAARVALPYG